MAVSFVAAGTGILSTALFQRPTLPAGIAVGDILLLVATNRNTTSATSAITIPIGWDILFDSVNSDGSIGGLNHLVVAWKRVDVVEREADPYVVFAGAITNISQVFAFRGVADVTPVIEQPVTSNTSAVNIGPLTGISLGANNGVVVIGHRADDWTSVDLLTGDGLTWQELTEIDTTVGDDAGIVVDFAPGTGSPVTVTSKTFTVVSGVGAGGLGAVLELAAGTPATDDFRNWTRNRVKETTTTTGTGPLTLAGAVDKFVGFHSFAVGEFFPYVVKDTSGNYEEGVGRRKSSNVLERTTVIASSNGDALVNFGAGDKTVFVPDAASDVIANMLLRWGDGSDGDVTISGSATLTRTMQYRVLTLASGAALVTNGFEIYAHLIDATAAPAGAISWDGVVGANASGSSAGVGGTALTSQHLGGSTVGATGGAGATGAGVAGGNSLASTASGGDAGSAGIGGDSSAAGGAGGTAGAATSLVLKTFGGTWLRGATLVLGGISGPGGGSGRGSDSILSGGGGGGGSAGGCVVLRALVLNRSGSTAAGAVRAKGAVGGNGGVAVAGGSNKRGGGGGGAGGAGGWIIAEVGVLTGSTATNFFDVSGGAGGGGGAGLNFSADPDTASGGRGGSGARGGRIDLSVGGNWTRLIPSDSPAAGTPGAPSGDTAGTGGTGSTWRLDL